MSSQPTSLHSRFVGQGVYVLPDGSNLSLCVIQAMKIYYERRLHANR
jgi:hypothetical protein